MNFDTLKLIGLSFCTSIGLFFTLSFTYTNWINPSNPQGEAATEKTNAAKNESHNARQSYAS